MSLKFQGTLTYGEPSDNIFVFRLTNPGSIRVVYTKKMCGISIFLRILCKLESA